MRRSPAVLASASLALACSAALAGDTNPPPGPVAGTMKTLDQIRPGTPLSEVPPGPNAAHLISEPGTYFLTEELAVGAGQHGIEINLDGLPPGEYYVCVELRSHPIRLGPGSLDGIHYTDSVGHTETIELCVGYQENYLGIISNAGDDGVEINGADHLRMRNLQITGSGGDAIRAGTAGICEWEDITIVGAGGSGINADGNNNGGYIKVKMTNVIISSVDIHGARASNFPDVRCEGVTINSAGGNGLFLRPNVVAGATVRAFTVVQDTKVTGSGADGVAIEPQTPGSYSFDLRVVDSSDNTGHGVRIEEAVIDSSFDVNLESVNAGDNGGDGIRQVHIGGGPAPCASHGAWKTCSTNNNGGNGSTLILSEVAISKSLDRCSASGNGGDGHRVETGPTESFTFAYRKCSFSYNAGSGVHVLPSGGAVSDHCIVEMTGCSATRNTEHGVNLDWTQTSGPFQFEIRDSTLSYNTNDGLRAIAADGCGIDNNCNSNGGRGTVATGKIELHGGTFNKNGAGGVRSENSSCWIRVAQLSSNMGNGAEAIGGQLTIDGGVFASNTGDGIYAEDADTAIAGCTSRDNGGNGATLTGINPDRKDMLQWYKSMRNAGSGLVVQNSDAAVITNCSSTGNGAWGIWCQNLVSNASIVENHCNGDGGGIRVDGFNNVLQRNSVTFGALGGISTAAGNLVGMPVDIANINTHSNPAANVER